MPTSVTILICTGIVDSIDVISSTSLSRKSRRKRNPKTSSSSGTSSGEFAPQVLEQMCLRWRLIADVLRQELVRQDKGEWWQVPLGTTRMFGSAEDSSSAEDGEGSESEEDDTSESSEECESGSSGSQNSSSGSELGSNQGESDSRPQDFHSGRRMNGPPCDSSSPWPRSPGPETSFAGAIQKLNCGDFPDVSATNSSGIQSPGSLSETNILGETSIGDDQRENRPSQNEESSASSEGRKSGTVDHSRIGIQVSAPRQNSVPVVTTLGKCT